MLENAPPALTDAVKTIALLKLLADPEGLGKITAELTALTTDAVTAYSKLGQRQKGIRAAEMALTQRQQEHEAAVKEHATASTALAAKSDDVDRRTQRLATERASHRESKEALDAAQAPLQRDLADLRKREDAASRLMAEAETLRDRAEAVRTEYEGRLKKLKQAVTAAS